jgi:hypothetical protein
MNQLRSQIRQLVPVALLGIAGLPGASMAQDAVVRVLGVPGYSELLRDLQAAGYSSTLYGPADRPAEGFDVFSIGASVPATQAIEILTLARRRIPSLNYVVLTGDRDAAAGGPNDVFVGGTTRSMDHFPAAAPLSERQFAELLRAGSARPDLFYANVRATYMPRASTAPAGSEGAFFIREDGILVVPDADGGASLYRSNGARGGRSADGLEIWPFANLAPVQPARQGASPNQQWLDQMNSWLEAMGNRLLRDLEVLLPDQASIDNYKAYEEQNAADLYDRVYLRRQYLSLVIDQMFPSE